jgi:hypothetical protein
MRCDRRWSARRIDATWWPAEVPPDPASDSSRRRLRSWGSGWSNRLEHCAARSQEPPKGFPMIGSYVAVPSDASKPPTPPLDGSEDPPIVGAVGSPTWRFLANESPLDRRWCRSGNERPEGLSPQSRPGFRASNEPARRPVRGRRSQRKRFPSGFGSNGTRQHEAALNDVPRLGSADAHRVSPRRVGPCYLPFRSPKGSIQQLLS